uniref:Uncharacterized protein n=1 Tax=Rhizophora mucronata TaxID=61149 RepID=A0A2P2MYS8_RHIMU
MTTTQDFSNSLQSKKDRMQLILQTIHPTAYLLGLRKEKEKLHASTHQKAIPSNVTSTILVKNYHYSKQKSDVTKDETMRL